MIIMPRGGHYNLKSVLLHSHNIKLTKLHNDFSIEIPVQKDQNSRARNRENSDSDINVTVR